MAVAAGRRRARGRGGGRGGAFARPRHGFVLADARWHRGTPVRTRVRAVAARPLAQRSGSPAKASMARVAGAEAAIDLGRYPLDEPRSSAFRTLVEGCREQLVASGACELPGFLVPEATARMVHEAEELVPLAHPSSGPITIYLAMPDDAFPEEHPRRRLGWSSLAAIGYDLFPPEHALRQLYEWDPLMDFLAACLGRERLFRYADPLGALNVAVMRDGDELWWHFDQTDFVVSIALRDAERGGDFEYVPHVRSADDERYDDVRAVLDGASPRVERVPMTPGTLLLFQGRHALHRVTRVAGEVSRLVALLAYDTKPGTVSSRLLRLARYGRDVPLAR